MTSHLLPLWKSLHHFLRNCQFEETCFIQNIDFKENLANKLVNGSFESNVTSNTCGQKKTKKQTHFSAHTSLFSQYCFHPVACFSSTPFFYKHQVNSVQPQLCL